MQWSSSAAIEHNCVIEMHQERPSSSWQTEWLDHA
jgi:hypothetical protein